MAYTECYVMNAAGAADTNGGAPLGFNGAPICTASNCDATGSSPILIEDKDNGGWPGVQVGDFGCWDTASAKSLFRVIGLSHGGDDDVIEIVAVGPSFVVTTGKAVSIGGAFATVAYALSAVRKTYRDVDDNPPRINVQAGTQYTGNAASAAAADWIYPVTMQGYTTSPGDGGEAELQLGITINHAYIRLVDLFVNRAAIGDGHAISGSGAACHFERVRAIATGASYDAFSLAAAEQSTLIGCTSLGAGRDGFSLYWNSHAVGCISLAAGRYGIKQEYGGRLLHCIVDGAGDDGIHVSEDDATTILACLIYGCTGDGVHHENTGLTILNSTIYGNGGYGVRLDVAGVTRIRRSAFGSNTSGPMLNVRTEWCEGLVTLAGDPCIDAAGGDYRIDPRTAAGQQLLRAAWPGAIDDVNVGHLDIGPLQSDLMAGRGMLSGGGL